MKKCLWTALGALILLTLLIAGGKSTKSGISTEAWRNSYADPPPAGLPGVQMRCIGSKLEPVCVGDGFGRAQGAFGNWLTHNAVGSGSLRGIETVPAGKDAIAGWYDGGRACRVLYDGHTFKIKEIACE